MLVDAGRYGVPVLKPPAGNPVKNPARGYDQELHATLSQLGPDLGCKGMTR